VPAEAVAARLGANLSRLAKWTRIGRGRFRPSLQRAQPTDELRYTLHLRILPVISPDIG